LYSRQHRHDEAVMTAREATEREPGAVMPWFILGLSLAMRGLSRGTLGDLARAIPPLLRAHALNPTYQPAPGLAGTLYELRGQAAHARLMADAAVAAERAGTGLIFIGSYVISAVRHLHAGESDQALPLLTHAIERFPSMDHVYAEVMTAWARVVRGCLYERAGELDSAQGDFTAAIAIAEQHDHRIGMGAHWVKSHFGLARVLDRAGERGASTEALRLGKAMLDGHGRFVWGLAPGCADAESWYELASAHATRGEVDQAVAALARAAQLGWANLPQIDGDPGFVALGDDRVRRVCIAATAAVALPPPVGSGGYPELF
jgi:tetratricopeptide (TPR) repeat protein